MNRSGLFWFYISFTVLAWSTVATVFKLTLRHLTPTEMLLYASMTGSVTLLVILVIQGKASELLNQSPVALARSAGLGLLNPFLYYTILFHAYDLLPAQMAQPLNFTWPLVLTVLSVFILGHKLRLRNLTAIAISYSGVFIVVTRGHLAELHVESWTGVVLALGSSLIWATYWLFNMRDKRNPLIKLTLSIGFGTLYILILQLWQGFTVPDPRGIPGAIYIGLLEMGITFLFWLKALETSRSPAQAANLVYITPFLSLLFISFFTPEKIHGSAVIGLVLIICGILIQTLHERTHAR